MAKAEKKFAFQLAAGLASDVLIESKYIQAGYIVVPDLTARGKLTIKSATDDGVIVEGSLVYVASEKKSYRYTNNKWEEDASDVDIAAIKTAIGTDTSNELYGVADRIYDEAVNAKYGTGTDGADITIKDKIDEAVESAYTNAAPTTVAVGGISKGTTFNNKPLKDLLDELFYPYVPFEFTTFSIGNATANKWNGDYEYGTSLTIDTLKYSSGLTVGSKTTTTVAKLSKTVGGTTTDIMNITNAFTDKSNRTVPSFTWDGKSALDCVVTFSDGTTSKSVTKTFNPIYSIYHTVTSSNTTVPTTGTKGNDSTISYGDNQYIWFFSKTAKSTIQQFTMGEWKPVASTTPKGTVTFTLSTGETATYYAYVGPETMSGSGRFRLN